MKKLNKPALLLAVALRSAKMIRCKPQTPEHFEYHRAWLDGKVTDKGFVASLTPVDDGESWIEIKFKPQVFM